MKVACFIPIKSNSERVKGKNLRDLNGKRLFEYICDHAKDAEVFDDIFIDTNSIEVKNYATELGLKVIEREPWLAKNNANGNDLLLHHYKLFPEYDYYFQLFATAPFLQSKTIAECVKELMNNPQFDSCFSATEMHGFFWFNGNPINYRPCVLPRSQDMTPIIEETTGIYGISKDSLNKYHCRIGAQPYVKIISKFEAVDINTEEDFQLAEYIGKIIYP